MFVVKSLWILKCLKELASALLSKGLAIAKVKLDFNYKSLSQLIKHFHSTDFITIELGKSAVIFNPIFAAVLLFSFTFQNFNYEHTSRNLSL